MPPTLARTLTLTALAMLAFAANSVLCRAALGSRLIDAASFTAIRIVSGAGTLWLIWWLTRSRHHPMKVDWPSASMLFAYAILFSFAYLSLSTGTGALILFGFVQLTMIGVGLARGQRPNALAWIGMALAVGGLIYLVSPGLQAPAPGGAALMAGAGVAWGVYSLRGQRARDAVTATAGNFIGAVPMALAAGLIFLAGIEASPAGVALAMVSGALASGVGYVIWYAALPGLTPTKAASVQLSVPAIAGLAGVLFLAEPLTPRLVLASITILGGIAIVLSQKR